MSKESFNNRIVKLSTYLAIFTSTSVLILKSYAWLMTGSVAVLASMVDSFLDMSISVINMLAIKYSFRGPDERRRFGFDKLQDLAVFGQSILFFISGILIIFKAISLLGEVRFEENLDIVANVMIFSVAMTFCLVLFQTYVLSKTSSNVIKADRVHYISDLFTNLAVILAINFSTEYPDIDSYLAILIALYLMYGSVGLFKTSFSNLIDQEFDEENRELLFNFLKKSKQEGLIINAHDIKTRIAGNRKFIQIHIELDGEMNLFKSHEISDKIMLRLKEIFPDSEVIIHQDPAGINEYIQYKDKI